MAAAAARCFRAMPTARSLLHLSRSRIPCTNTAVVVVAERPGAAGGAPHQATLEESMEELVGRTGVVGANSLAWISSRNESLSAVLPTLEAVNRNARRPKKANHGKRPCSHVGRRQRRRRKNIIKNGP